MTAHKEANALATATLMEIISKGKATQAAVIRGDSPATQEAIRQDAHSLLDAYIDQMGDAARHVRAAIEGEPDAAQLLADGARRLED